MAGILDTLKTYPVTARLLAAVERTRLGSRLLALARGNEKELRRFVKFALVGTLGAVVDFTVLNLLILGAGFPKVWANTVSFSVAVLSNFTWNRLWSFPESRQRPLRTQLPQFALVNLVGLAINQVVFLGLDHYIFGPHFGPLGYNLAKAVAIVIVLFWNFGINRIWTYRGL
ncbi:MAG: GtrA family protein [Chloroflexi bacterium]|nr:GtrA family protein [Chloroflexota bacterium]